MPVKKKRNYPQERRTANARGETGVGSKSGDATRHRARRKLIKATGKKLSTKQHVDHKKPIKQGGSNGTGNLRVRTASSNYRAGGKIGNKSGKASGGRKSRK